MNCYTSLLEAVNHGELAWCFVEMLKKGAWPKSVLILSPSRSDYLFIKKVFPTQRLFISTINDWNLNETPPRGMGNFDLVVASNVFMYSQDPSGWFENVLKTCDYLVIQDLKYRKRSATRPFFGQDGDAMRYTVDGTNKVQLPQFDLEQLRHQIIYSHEFHGVRNLFHDPDDLPIHICALIRSAGQERRDVASSDGWRRILLIVQGWFYRRAFTLLMCKLFWTIVNWSIRRTHPAVIH